MSRSQNYLSLNGSKLSELRYFKHIYKNITHITHIYNNMNHINTVPNKSIYVDTAYEIDMVLKYLHSCESLHNRHAHVPIRHTHVPIDCMILAKYAL